MITRIILKNSLQPGKAPLPSDLVVGEVALNVADGALYALNTMGQVVEVRPLNLRDGQVLTSKLADLAVTTGKIADEAVTIDKLSPEVQALLARTIDTASIANGSITTEKLADGAVTSGKLASSLEHFLKSTSGRYLGEASGYAEGAGPASRDYNGAFVGENFIRKGDFYFNVEQGAFFIASANGGAEVSWVRVGNKTIGTASLDDGSVTLSKLAGEVMALVDSKVAAEGSAREASDALINDRISKLLSNVDPAALDSLTEIVTAFQAADSDLTAALASLSTAASSALAAETAARVAADADLQTQVTAEVVARAALGDKVAQEILDRKAAIDAVNSRVSTEVLSIGSQLFTESENRVNGDAALQSQVNALNSTVGVLRNDLTAVDTQRTSDNTLMGQRVDGLYNALQAEAAARISGDSALTNAVQTEVFERSAAVQAEADARAQALLDMQAQFGDELTVTNNALTAETAARVAGDSALQNALNAEVSARQLADSAMQVALDAEVAARVAAGTANDTALANLETVFQGAVDGIEAGMTAEAAARAAADTALAARVSTLEGEINGGTF